MGMAALSIIVAAIADTDFDTADPHAIYLFIVLTVVAILMERGWVSSIFRRSTKALPDNPGSGHVSSAETKGGKVLRDVQPEDPEIAGAGRTLQEVHAQDTEQGAEYPLSALLRLATDIGVEDLAARHDKYAHRMSEQHDGHSD
jgi:hypothetical protein